MSRRSALPSKQDTLILCWLNVGPPSAVPKLSNHVSSQCIVFAGYKKPSNQKYPCKHHTYHILFEILHILMWQILITSFKPSSPQLVCCSNSLLISLLISLHIVIFFNIFFFNVSILYFVYSIPSVMPRRTTSGNLCCF